MHLWSLMLLALDLDLVMHRCLVCGAECRWLSIAEKHPDDFVVLGFPCNQFGSQEPGSNDEIQSFCRVNYGVTFPIMQKVEVNGDKWLKSERLGLLGLKRIKWNFKSFSWVATAASSIAGRAPPPPSRSRRRLSPRSTKRPPDSLG
ncbi:hypothetical protein NHJ13734_005824 [Beauveria thailandica]